MTDPNILIVLQEIRDAFRSIAKAIEKLAENTRRL